MPAVAPDGDESEQGLIKVNAADTGWVTHIDYAALAHGLPVGGVARLVVQVGELVFQGTTVATVSVDGKSQDINHAEAASAFVVSDERHLEDDAEYGLLNLVALAQHHVSSGADRQTAFEALRCIGVLLNELLRREPVPTVLAFDDDRLVVRRFGRSHEDIVRATR